VFGSDRSCGCEPTFERERLLVDAADCPGAGPATDPDCRATAVEALRERSAEAVVVRRRGRACTYRGPGARLLVAAGRFAEAVAVHDDRLATLAARDPLRAARDASARASPVADLATDSGLLAAATGPAAYADRFEPWLSPTVARSTVALAPPEGARLLDRRELDTGAVARRYDDGRRWYHVRPPELRLDPSALATLAAARERLATADGPADDRAPGRAVRAVADPGDPVVELTAALAKHTRGCGVVADLLADDRVTDVYATAPVGQTPLRVVLDGETVPTNVRLRPEGARALASRLRRESGRAFSRANPTLDATTRVNSSGAATDGGDRVRVAGVTDPVSDGVAFAFRDDRQTAATLPWLVAQGTLSPRVAAVLSLAVERGAAVLLAGGRGAGKTTALGALLWELSPGVRTVVVEDTPELPVERLQEADRDVQALRTAVEDGPGVDAARALRTALRMGEGALVVGEVRGEEATVLYEAMRVGAGDAVLGTVHGDGAEAVRERVTADLGVPPSSFAATDLVATLAPVGTDEGRQRRVVAVDEVVPADGDGVEFAPLARLDGTTPTSTGRVERGNSRLVADLLGPDEAYADALDRLQRRERRLAALARDGRTDPAAVVAARRSGPTDADGASLDADGHRSCVTGGVGR
jgi:type IV secretory pathway ATPase VirB11/archaellum biosynthesis ATPase